MAKDSGDICYIASLRHCFLVRSSFSLHFVKGIFCCGGRVGVGRNIFSKGFGGELGFRTPAVYYFCYSKFSVSGVTKYGEGF